MTDSTFLNMRCLLIYLVCRCQIGISFHLLRNGFDMHSTLLMDINRILMLVARYRRISSKVVTQREDIVVWRFSSGVYFEVVFHQV